MSFSELALLEANASPIAPTLSSPTNGGTASSTTPTLDFSTTDPESNNVRYEVQVDSTNLFGISTPAWKQSISNSTSSSGTTLTATFGTATTTGNAILVAVGTANASFLTVSSITDSQSNTYVKLLTKTNTIDAELWAAYNITGGTNTVTVHFSGSGNAAEVVAQEFSGISSSPLDASTSNSGSSTNSTSGTTANTTQTEELVVAFTVLQSNVAITAGSGYSNIKNDHGSGSISLAMESAVVSSIGTQSAGFVHTTGVWAAGIATFKASVGSPLIDAVSGTAAGFSDITNPGDTDPFPSGDSMGYTVQSALTNGNTYFWRARATDPSGSGAWSAWSSTFSFTVSAGAGGNTSNFFQFL